MGRIKYETGERERATNSYGDAKASELPDRSIELILSDFAVNESELKQAHKQALADMVRLYNLGRTGARYFVALVEGYTDAVGEEADNVKLRNLRANKVAGWIEGLVLSVNSGYQPTETVLPASAGKYLNAQNDTPTARAANRGVRVVMKRIPSQVSFFTVRMHPTTFNKYNETFGVVSTDAWLKNYFPVAGLSIYGRGAWASKKEPLWEKGITYYNTHQKPLKDFYDTIVVHHTANRDTLDENEKKKQRQGYAALGYHFAIGGKGTIFQGRPLEVMGAHAGEIKNSGEMGDPDWGALGIVLMGDFHSDRTNLWRPDKPNQVQLKSLKDLVTALQGRWGITRLLMHKEVTRDGDPTVCPGENMYRHFEDLRKDLKMRGPARP